MPERHPRRIEAGTDAYDQYLRWPDPDDPAVRWQFRRNSVQYRLANLNLYLVSRTYEPIRSKEQADDLREDGPKALDHTISLLEKLIEQYPDNKALIASRLPSGTTKRRCSMKKIPTSQNVPEPVSRDPAAAGRAFTKDFGRGASKPRRSGSPAIPRRCATRCSIHIETVLQLVPEKQTRNVHTHGHPQNGIEGDRSLGRIRCTYPPRGLSHEEAARYVDSAPTKFDKMIQEGLMPRPKRLGKRVVSDSVALDIAFTALPTRARI